jgi:hypothetical protein
MYYRTGLGSGYLLIMSSAAHRKFDRLFADRTAQRIMSPVRCGVQESGVPARMPWRLSPQMQYDRVFPVAMPGELHIPPFCTLQQMEAEIPAAVHIGGYFASAAVRAGDDG